MDGAELDQLIAQLEAERAQRTIGQPALLAADEDAWERLRVHLRRTAGRIIPPNDLDDVVQTVLLKLQTLGALRRLRASRSAAGYLAVMLRNAAVDAMRRGQGDLEGTDVPEEADEAASPSDLIGSAERAQRLRALTATLSESDRELLRLRYWDDLTIAEMARQYRVSYSTMAVRLFRIVVRLRAQLGPAAEAWW